MNVQDSSDYYDKSHDYYQKIWGNNISIGLHNPSDISLQEACNNTLDVMIALFRKLDDVNILDLGSGYGETARYLARKGACVTCLNISQVQNDHNIQCNEAEGLADKITVMTGSFEKIPSEDSCFDIVISRDALMYSKDRKSVFSETRRALKDGGDFVFTDFLIGENIPDTADRSFVEDDPYVESLESLLSYKILAEGVGFCTRNMLDFSHHFANHYRKLNEIFEKSKEELAEIMPKNAIEFFVENNLERRILPCKKGYLKWGILHFSKN